MKMVLTFYVIETHVVTIKNVHSSILSSFELRIHWDIEMLHYVNVLKGYWNIVFRAQCKKQVNTNNVLI